MVISDLNAFARLTSILCMLQPEQDLLCLAHSATLEYQAGSFTHISTINQAFLVKKADKLQKVFKQPGNASCKDKIICYKVQYCSSL